jgi:hypothetical protein
MQTGAQLKVGNTFIPNESYTTTGVIHLRDQEELAELDGQLNPSKEFADSILLSRNNPNDSDHPYANSMRDDTSYLPEFQTERMDGGYVIDGLNTDGKSVPIEYKAKPQYTGTNDTYYRPDGTTGSANTQIPSLWECRDTFFVLHQKKGSKDFKLSYFNDRTPNGSQQSE